MADGERVSRDHREEMIGSEERLARYYIDLQELINKTDGLDFIYKVTAPIADKDDSELSEYMVNHILLKTWKGRRSAQQSEIDPERVAVFMIC